MMRTSSTANALLRSVFEQGRPGFYVAAVLVCSLSCWQGVQAARPFLLADRIKSDNDRVEREVKRYQIQNQRAERAVRLMEMASGMESQARSLGWVKPAETHLRIPRK